MTWTDKFEKKEKPGDHTKPRKTTCANCGRNMTPLTQSLRPHGKGWQATSGGGIYYCGRC